ncbi:ABC transporter ATP-binding protein [Microaerobacter geothermalis]|nr:ABC transporter ATP-binding protein [Microaerobacter geothermalis]MCF6092477.1 ABC transporter ATP-binding protein [Microaerobacter geothermalis]
MMSVIQLQNISWVREDKTILNQVNWQVNRGEHWAIVGLNGSGKTSLLHMIVGYEWPTKGKVSVLGQEFGKCDVRELRKSIGWVSSSFQERIYGQDLVHDVVLSGKFASIGIYEETDERDHEKVKNLLEQFGLIKLSNQFYRFLSQGEKQKVLIARALMASPQLLILDESCSGLDILSREMVLDMVKVLGEDPEGPTIIYVTHHVEEILPVISHVLLLEDGKVAAAGEKKEVLTEGILSRIFQLPLQLEWKFNRPWIQIGS